MNRLALVGLLAACRSPAPAPPPAVDPFAHDPVAVMAALEDRLTAAQLADITATVRTEGVFALALTGELHVEREGVSWIKLRQDGEVTDKWSSRTPVDPTAKSTQPPTWADGLLIGLTRMGITHNFANVMDGSDPETGHGDIHTWVTYGDVTWSSDDPRSRTLAFTLSVVGGSVAEAELALDERGLPVRRTQVVHFDDGEMRVIEDYARFDLVE